MYKREDKKNRKQNLEIILLDLLKGLKKISCGDMAQKYMMNQEWMTIPFSLMESFQQSNNSLIFSKYIK